MLSKDYKIIIDGDTEREVTATYESVLNINQRQGIMPKIKKDVNMEQPISQEEIKGLIQDAITENNTKLLAQVEANNHKILSQIEAMLNNIISQNKEPQVETQVEQKAVENQVETQEAPKTVEEPQVETQAVDELLAIDYSVVSDDFENVARGWKDNVGKKWSDLDLETLLEAKKYVTLYNRDVKYFDYINFSIAEVASVYQDKAKLGTMPKAELEHVFKVLTMGGEHQIAKVLGSYLHEKAELEAKVSAEEYLQAEEDDPFSDVSDDYNGIEISKEEPKEVPKETPKAVEPKVDPDASALKPYRDWYRDKFLDTMQPISLPAYSCLCAGIVKEVVKNEKTGMTTLKVSISAFFKSWVNTKPRIREAIAETLEQLGVSDTISLEFFEAYTFRSIGEKLAYKLDAVKVN